MENSENSWKQVVANWHRSRELKLSKYSLSNKNISSLDIKLVIEEIYKHHQQNHQQNYI